MSDDDIERVANELVGRPVDSHVSRAYHRDSLREEFHQLTAVDQETRARMWRAIAEREERRWSIEHAGAPCNVPKNFERSDIPMLIGFVLAALLVLFAVCDGGAL